NYLHAQPTFKKLGDDGTQPTFGFISGNRVADGLGNNKPRPRLILGGTNICRYNNVPIAETGTGTLCIKKLCCSAYPLVLRQHSIRLLSPPAPTRPTRRLDVRDPCHGGRPRLHDRREYAYGDGRHAYGPGGGYSAAKAPWSRLILHTQSNAEACLGTPFKLTLT